MKISRYGYAIERLGNRYRLVGTLGSGGMADVCLAWDEHKEQKVAIKVIKTDDNFSPEALNRFVKEGSLVVGWNHPHILCVYDNMKLELLDKERGSMVPYIVTEYVQGGNLKERLTSCQPYPPDLTLSVFSQLCNAVQYAHEQNVIHRDIKPSNVLFRHLPDGTEQAVLSDFGLAVSTDAGSITFPHGGTPAYMAPEQWRGQAQKASDIFALGVVFYRLCTGHLPFKFQPNGLIPPTRPSKLNPALPSELDEVILTALAEDPALRFSNARQFWEQVASILSTSQSSLNKQTDARDQAEKQRARYLQQKLLKLILSLTNSAHRRVLLYVYIAGLNEQEVAQRLQLPTQRINLLRLEALKELNTILQAMGDLHSLPE